jgi:DNA-binding transcriptional ArsR family regulator
MVNKSNTHIGAELGEAQLQEVARLFDMLSQTSRLRIIQALHHGPASVHQIMESTGLKQANASKQLGLLYQAGILARQKDGNTIRYEIRLPLVFDLCTLVCDSRRADAEAKARLLQSAG